MFNFGALGLRARFARKSPIGAFWMTAGSTAVMEIAAEAAPDAIVIDAQHGLWDRQTLEHAVGLVSNRAPVLIRTADASAISISQALDTGAEGVIVPLIETDEQAAAGGCGCALSPAWTALWRRGAPADARLRSVLRRRERPHRRWRNDRDAARGA